VRQHGRTHVRHGEAHRLQHRGGFILDAFVDACANDRLRGASCVRIASATFRGQRCRSKRFTTKRRDFQCDRARQFNPGRDRQGEADAEQLLDVLASEECAIGAPTLVETRTWCSIDLAARSSSWLEHFVGSGRGAVVPFSREMADAASAAFDQFSRASDPFRTAEGPNLRDNQWRG
jgi:hypothetical protein